MLSPLTRSFNIENGRLVGEGADFIRSQMSESQITMLGEYHNSANISHFTAALIPDAHDLGYGNFVLEVGPISALKLGDTIIKKEGVASALRSLIHKYGWKTEEGIEYPIPFFSKLEDAPFLEAALERKWQLIGVDQEFFDSYFMLVDYMFEQLEASEQKNWSARFDQVRDTLEFYYRDELDGRSDYAINIDESAFLQSFLDDISEIDQIEPAASALRKSAGIYRLYADRKWFENNATRVRHMKENFRQQVEEFGVDLSREKVLAKMGGIHLAKGRSSQGIFDMGSLLTEIAEYHGSKSLSLIFQRRFMEWEGEVIDLIERENPWLPRLIQMGQMDKWIVIDLRPLIPGYDYRPQKYFLDSAEWDYVRRYDLLVISPLEKPASNNY